MTKPIWERPLDTLNGEEWESLCDGCARCCLIKLEDEETGERYTTSVACRYLDLEQCRCGVYGERTTRVPSCVRVTPENIAELDWMPQSCGYRLMAEGKGLADWHPLRSGDPESVHRDGISVRHFAISEEGIAEADLEDYLVD